MIKFNPSYNLIIDFKKGTITDKKIDIFDMKKNVM